MPELPDITAYLSALEPRIVGQPLEHVRITSAFLLRTVRPPVASVEGRVVRELRRIGKRIAMGMENDLWLVAQAVERNYLLVTTDQRLADRFIPAIAELRVSVV